MKYIYSFIIILVSLGLFFVVGIPQYRLLSAERIHNKEVQKGLEIIGAASDTVKSLVTKVNALRADDLKKINSIIPEEFDNTLFAHYVSKLSVKHGLTMRSITTSQVSDESTDVVAYDVSITLSGKYDEQVKEFLSDMSKNIAWSRATKFSASRQNDKGDMTYEITVRTYANK